MDISKIAHLAQIHLEPEEARKISEQIPSILKYFEQIKDVNTIGVEPLVTPSDLEMVMRPDRVEHWAGAAAALEQAPELVGNLFRVPPVVG